VKVVVIVADVGGDVLRGLGFFRGVRCIEDQRVPSRARHLVFGEAARDFLQTRRARFDA
jgi:hypothetical protein